MKAYDNADTSCSLASEICSNDARTNWAYPGWASAVGPEHPPQSLSRQLALLQQQQPRIRKEGKAYVFQHCNLSLCTQKHFWTLGLVPTSCNSQSDKVCKRCSSHCFSHEAPGEQRWQFWSISGASNNSKLYTQLHQDLVQSTWVCSRQLSLCTQNNVSPTFNKSLPDQNSMSEDI